MELKSINIGIIGHRYWDSETSDFFVHTSCHEVLTQLMKKSADIKVLSAISQGADSIFAQSALELNIKLESIIPYDGFDLDFPDKTSYERYKLLLNNSDTEIRTSFTQRSLAAYKRSMEWIVFKSDIIVAVWDGKSIGSEAGTWAALLLCSKLRKHVIHIDIKNKSINYRLDLTKIHN